MNSAPRLSFVRLHRAMRGAVLTLSVLWAGAAAGQSLEGRCDAADWQGEPLVRATYEHPTARYPHGVLGDEIEYGRLTLTYGTSNKIDITLPDDQVFEDLAPRIVDVDGDGQAREVVAVVSHKDLGARLAIFDGCGLVTATPYIGQRYRWLAPAAVADLDGDGHVELAYVDRPHLAKILRVWRFDGAKLSQVAALEGLSNHRIGWDYIIGGLRNCGEAPEMILARGDWRRVMAVRFEDDALSARELGPYSQDRLQEALACSP
ncbi:MAG: VCBS repeat-containing protein [Pelagimonas sp.]|jgi:hypothetical protein|nr:VCBS repeat-containing protein [Pelagimonas sp.]